MSFKDERFEGYITPKKRLKICCETCNNDINMCKEDDEILFNDFGFKSEYEWCLDKQHPYHLWSPASKYKSIFCEGCKMYGLLGGYTNTNEFDYPYYKCCRHSEPCFRNSEYYNDNDPCPNCGYIERDKDVWSDE